MCQYAFFIRHVLGIEPLEAMERDMAAKQPSAKEVLNEVHGITLTLMILVIIIEE